MGWIGIGVGLLIAGLSSFGSIENRPASIVVIVVAVFLICYGVWEIWGRQHIFLERRIKGWLIKADWSVKSEEKPQFHFFIWAKDPVGRELGISRETKRKEILAFTALVKKEKDWDLKLAGLDDTQKYRLTEDIKIFLAGMDIGYDKAMWPLNKVSVQGGLLLDNNISGYIVDLKAKSVINAVIGVRSIIRRAIAS